jgi:hypothetical protein
MCSGFFLAETQLQALRLELIDKNPMTGMFAYLIRELPHKSSE